MQIIRVELNGECFYAKLEGNKALRLVHEPFSSIELTDKEYNLSDLKLLAPCEPTKVVAVGLNYGEHVQEMKDDMQRKADPILFIKPSSSIIADGETIVRPLHMSERTDYEAELGVVIGKTMKNIKIEDTKDYFFGYTCVNDVTARDLQKSDGQWTRAKGFDTFCPIGPHIETELNPDNLHVQGILNGEVMQDDTTASMINNIYELASHISKIMTLYPGDVIATGTPKGISPMVEGDEFIVRIEGIGDLKNVVK